MTAAAARPVLPGAGGARQGLPACGLRGPRRRHRRAPRYAGDALHARRCPARSESLPRYGHGFDAIHASHRRARTTAPPKPARRRDRPAHRAGRELLRTSGLPYVIENVAGAKRDLINPRSALRLGVRPRRPPTTALFETSWPVLFAPPCAHLERLALIDAAGSWWLTAATARRRWRHGRKPRSLAPARSDDGIDWRGPARAAEATPPAYADHGRDPSRHSLRRRRGLPDDRADDLADRGDLAAQRRRCRGAVTATSTGAASTATPVTDVPSASDAQRALPSG